MPMSHVIANADRFDDVSSEQFLAGRLSPTPQGFRTDSVSDRRDVGQGAQVEHAVPGAVAGLALGQNGPPSLSSDRMEYTDLNRISLEHRASADSVSAEISGVDPSTLQVQFPSVPGSLGQPVGREDGLDQHLPRSPGHERTSASAQNKKHDG